MRGRTQVPDIVDWYMDGKIAIDPLITHKLPLERINEAFDLMHSGESIRTVIEFCDPPPFTMGGLDPPIQLYTAQGKLGGRVKPGHGEFREWRRSAMSGP